MGPWLRKQNQTWYVQLGGRQVNLGKNKRAAFAKYHQLMGEGGPVADHRVRDILSAHWDWLKTNRAVTTREKRQAVLKSFGLSIPATLRIRDLKAFHVQRWVDQFTWGPTTQNTRIGWIKTAINWGVKMGYAGANPIAAMEKPRPVVRQEFLPVDQWTRLLESCKPDLRDFVTVMLDSGARVQEMFLYEAKHFDGGRLVLPIEDSKGRRRSRVVNLPPVSLEIVKRLVAEYPDGKLFRTSKGIEWKRNTLRCRFRPLKRIMGMPKLCATTLRHSFAHHRLTSKQDSLTVAKLMGHVDTRMVATRYGHLEDTEYLVSEANRISFPSIQKDGPDTVRDQQA
jgi:integrase